MPDTQYEVFKDKLPEEALLNLKYLTRKRYKAMVENDDATWNEAVIRMQSILLGLSYAGFASYGDLLRFGTKLFDEVMTEEVDKEMKEAAENGD